jgi:colanic acid biosynthesis glycosyl transferase WcaI
VPQRALNAVSEPPASTERRRSVLFVNRVYPPDTSATAAMLHSAARAAVAEGWQVTVLTSGPAGSSEPHIREVRVPVPPLDKRHLLRRLIGYLRLYPALVWRLIALPRHDVIVTMTDPPMIAAWALLAAPFKRSRLVHWAQDVYPQIAILAGVLREGILASALRWVAMRALNRYHAVIVIGRCMRDALVGSGVRPERIKLVPNWSDLVPERRAREPNGLRAAHGLGHRFVVMYSGNFGYSHPFDAVLDAAEQLRDIRPDIAFVLIGAGSHHGKVVEAVEQRQLANVRLLPFQPVDTLSDSLAAADLHLVTMSPAVLGLMVPSKIYSVLATGRPVLFVGPGESEAAKLVEEAGAGLVVTDGAALACAIDRLATDPRHAEAMGRQALAAAQCWDRAAATHRLLAEIAGV